MELEAMRMVVSQWLAPSEELNPMACMTGPIPKGPYTHSLMGQGIRGITYLDKHIQVGLIGEGDQGTSLGHSCTRACSHA